MTLKKKIKKITTSGQLYTSIDKFLTGLYCNYCHVRTTLGGKWSNNHLLYVYDECISISLDSFDAHHGVKFAQNLVLEDVKNFQCFHIELKWLPQFVGSLIYNSTYFMYKALDGLYCLDE